MMPAFVEIHGEYIIGMCISLKGKEFFLCEDLKKELIMSIYFEIIITYHSFFLAQLVAFEMRL